MSLILYLGVTTIISLLASGFMKDSFENTIISLIASLAFSTIWYYIFN